MSSQRARGIMEMFGSLLDCRVRRYLDGWERLCPQDSLMLVECCIAWALSEFYVLVVLPALGLQSGLPCPWAGYFSRTGLFFLGPLSYMAMYFTICGSIHIAYTQIWPEEGNRLSIQGKAATDAEILKAIGFSMKSITSTAFVHAFMYQTLNGKTNIYWGTPHVADIPWFILAYLLVDIVAYLVHRRLHHPWWYARVHKAHHLWKNPTVWVVSALHPTELLALTVPTLAILTAMPVSFPMFVTLLLWIFVCNAIDHSGLKLESWPIFRLLFWQAHPEFHDNHHQYFHANYGAMVDWWDRLGGTYYHPKDNGPRVVLNESQFLSVRELQARASREARGG